MSAPSSSTSAPAPSPVRRILREPELPCPHPDTSPTDEIWRVFRTCVRRDYDVDADAALQTWAPCLPCYEHLRGLCETTGNNTAVQISATAYLRARRDALPATLGHVFWQALFQDNSALVLSSDVVAGATATDMSMSPDEYVDVVARREAGRHYDTTSTARVTPSAPPRPRAKKPRRVTPQTSAWYVPPVRTVAPLRRRVNAMHAVWKRLHATYAAEPLQCMLAVNAYNDLVCVSQAMTMAVVEADERTGTDTAVPSPSPSPSPSNSNSNSNDADLMSPAASPCASTSASSAHGGPSPTPTPTANANADASATSSSESSEDDPPDPFADDMETRNVAMVPLHKYPREACDDVHGLPSYGPFRAHGARVVAHKNPLQRCLDAAHATFATLLRYQDEPFVYMPTYIALFRDVSHWIRTLGRLRRKVHTRYAFCQDFDRWQQRTCERLRKNRTQTWCGQNIIPPHDLFKRMVDAAAKVPCKRSEQHPESWARWQQLLAVLRERVQTDRECFLTLEDVANAIVGLARRVLCASDADKMFRRCRDKFIPQREENLRRFYKMVVQFYLVQRGQSPTDTPPVAHDWVYEYRRCMATQVEAERYAVDHACHVWLRYLQDCRLQWAVTAIVATHRLRTTSRADERAVLHAGLPWFDVAHVWPYLFDGDNLVPFTPIAMPSAVNTKDQKDVLSPADEDARLKERHHIDMVRSRADARVRITDEYRGADINVPPDARARDTPAPNAFQLPYLCATVRLCHTHMRYGEAWVAAADRKKPSDIVHDGLVLWHRVLVNLAAQGRWLAFLFVAAWRLTCFGSLPRVLQYIHKNKADGGAFPHPFALTPDIAAADVPGWATSWGAWARGTQTALRVIVNDLRLEALPSTCLVGGAPKRVTLPACLQPFMTVLSLAFVTRWHRQQWTFCVDTTKDCVNAYLRRTFLDVCAPPHNDTANNVDGLCAAVRRALRPVATPYVATLRREDCPAGKAYEYRMLELDVLTSRAISILVRVAARRAAQARATKEAPRDMDDETARQELRELFPWFDDVFVRGNVRALPKTFVD